jgi:hypothetical protein
MIRQMLNWNTDVVLAYNGSRIAASGAYEAPNFQPPIN